MANCGENVVRWCRQLNLVKVWCIRKNVALFVKTLVKIVKMWHIVKMVNNGKNEAHS